MSKHPLRATLMLFLATVFWGLSFPMMKAFDQFERSVFPGVTSWFTASSSLFLRFAAAALILGIFQGRACKNLSRQEFSQGLGLGLFGGLGILFQMDALAYTPASTSAFLTQCYCIIIPVVIALREKRWPAKTVSVSCALVLAGVAILAQFDFRSLRLGRGEWETIVASLFFTGQILWLNRPVFSGCQPQRSTLVMFVVTALFVAPVTLISFPAGNLRAGIEHPAPLLMIATLTVFCTLLAYSMMNIFQPQISTTQAGLIYCAEPVFASLFALFLPSVLSRLARIDYQNETLTSHLVVGGSLITLANILLIFRQATQKP